MQLRLIHGRPPEQLFDLPPGRPGDWSEPVRLAPIDAAALASAADSRRISRDLLAAALVERALLIRDLDAANPALLDALDENAVWARPTPGPGAPLHSYVRDLRGGSGDANRRRDPGDLFVIPLRLHHELDDLSATEVDSAHSDQALAWEIAAACDARLMREWGLLVALRTLA